MSNFIPNANPNLVVLRVWKESAMQDVAEFPIIAWRMGDDDERPVPISTDGEMFEDDHGTASVVYDRASKLGAFPCGNSYGRDQCIKELHAAIDSCRQKRGKS